MGGYQVVGTAARQGAQLKAEAPHAVHHEDQRERPHGVARAYARHGRPQGDAEQRLPGPAQRTARQRHRGAQAGHRSRNEQKARQRAPERQGVQAVDGLGVTHQQQAGRQQGKHAHRRQQGLGVALGGGKGGRVAHGRLEQGRHHVEPVVEQQERRRVGRG